MSDSYKVYASKDYVDKKVPDTGGDVNKMLVTDVGGNTVWKDRLLTSERVFSTDYDEVTFTFDKTAEYIVVREYPTVYYNFQKASDYVYAPEGVLAGAFWMSNDLESKQITLSFDTICGGKLYLCGYIMICTEPGEYSFTLNGYENTVVFPAAGTYFARRTNDNAYVCKAHMYPHFDVALLKSKTLYIPSGATLTLAEGATVNDETGTIARTDDVPSIEGLASKDYVDEAVASAFMNIPSGLPDVTTDNNGAFLRVVDGAWAVATIANAEEASF